jgi:hypothetical protein
MLGAFETEMSFILSDMQEVLRSRADRAFEHLQCMIVADSDYKAKWQAAFDRGEEACEQLGCTRFAAWHLGFQGQCQGRAH